LRLDACGYVFGLWSYLANNNKKLMTSILNFNAELVPVAYAEALLELLEELDVSREQVYAGANVRPQVLDSPQGRLSSVDFNLLALSALRLSNEPALGLLLGRRLNVS